MVAESRGFESGAAGCECLLSLPRVPLTLVPYQWLGKVLAACLDALLPYLLYRAQVRYKHDPRAPSHKYSIKGSLSPHAIHDGLLSAEAAPDDKGTLPSFPRRISGAGCRDSLSSPSTSIQLTSPARPPRAPKLPDEQLAFPREPPLVVVVRPEAPRHPPARAADRVSPRVVALVRVGDGRRVREEGGGRAAPGGTGGAGKVA